MKRFRYIELSFAMLLFAAVIVPVMFPLTDTALFTGNYRMPYSMGYDYFLYNRYSEQVASMDVIPVLGDSVIWGHYTDAEHSLTANLNRAYNLKKFMNMGLDGIHPAAMKGLVEMNLPYLRNRKIIAGINLLWMSSPRHDLSGPVNREINHKMLLPQFYPVIPSYSPTVEERFSALINRSVTFFLWVDHVRSGYFAGKNFYLWTMENPRTSITGYFSGTKDSFIPPEGTAQEKIQQQNIDWVDTGKSLQWRFMVETLILLKNNGNRVCAVITPFNAHMMNQESRKKYYAILYNIDQALRSNGIMPLMLLNPDKKYFADASHPTAEGYRLIVSHIIKNKEFLKFLGE
jgi:hypothetical protein